MSIYRVAEVYDGRLPEYQVIKETPDKNQIVIKTFDSFEEAEKFCKDQLNDKTTPCGEEDPCYWQN